MAVNTTRDNNVNYANNGNNDEVFFSIMSHIGVLAEYQTGWKKEVNIVAWNGTPPKFDVRDWSPDHERMSRGITLHEEEARKLAEHLNRRFRGGVRMVHQPVANAAPAPAAAASVEQAAAEDMVEQSVVSAGVAEETKIEDAAADELVLEGAEEELDENEDSEEEFAESEDAEEGALENEDDEE